METFENQSKQEQVFERVEEEVSSFKQKLGNFGRRIKRVDLRSQIVGHPFAAVGIAAGVGALIGLARPMPKRGPIAGLMMGLLSTIGFRLAREAAMVQLGAYAKGLMAKNEQGQRGMESNVPQSGQSAY
jgi:hypothetical protein